MSMAVRFKPSCDPKASVGICTVAFRCIHPQLHVVPASSGARAVPMLCVSRCFKKQQVEVVVCCSMAFFMQDAEHAGVAT